MDDAMPEEALTGLLPHPIMRSHSVINKSKYGERRPEAYILF